MLNIGRSIRKKGFANRKGNESFLFLFPHEETEKEMKSLVHEKIEG